MKFTSPGLMLGLILAGIIASAPVQASESAQPTQPVAQDTTVQPVVQLAWDRVGSPIQTVV